VAIGVQNDRMTMRTLITAAALGLGIAASAQNSTDAMELLRSDIRAQKQAIVLANLGLNEQQSAVFAPIYDEYTAALKAVWDKKLLLVKDYSTSYHGTMTEETAKSLLKRSDELEKEVLSVRGTYEKKMMKVLPATVVARWIQIERRLGQLIDLQIEDQMPLMPVTK
jgi:hypothetical protein